MQDDKIQMHTSMIADLIGCAIRTLPKKAYGVIGGTDIFHPTSVYQCYTNIRSSPEFDSVFRRFGEFYCNPDRGFVVAPEENAAVMNKILSKHERLVGIFHTHRCTVPGEPSIVDRTLHVEGGMGDIIQYIVDVKNPAAPTLRAFSILAVDHHREVPFEIIGGYVCAK